MMLWLNSKNKATSMVLKPWNTENSVFFLLSGRLIIRISWLAEFFDMKKCNSSGLIDKNFLMGYEVFVYWKLHLVPKMKTRKTKTVQSDKFEYNNHFVTSGLKNQSVQILGKLVTSFVRLRGLSARPKASVLYTKQILSTREVKEDVEISNSSGWAVLHMPSKRDTEKF